MKGGMTSSSNLLVLLVIFSGSINLNPFHGAIDLLFSGRSTNNDSNDNDNTGGQQWRRRYSSMMSLVSATDTDSENNATEETDVDAAAADSTTAEDDPFCDANNTRWSQANIQEVVSSWKYDEKERAVFDNLQKRLQDIDHWKNNPGELARFLSEHEFDIDTAEQKFRGMIQWRLDNDMERFFERYKGPDPVFYYLPNCLLKGLDYDNDPIAIQRLGSADGLGLIHKMGAEAMLEGAIFVQELQSCREYFDGIPKHWNWQREYYEPLAGRRMTQFTIVVDMSGLSTRLLRPAMISVLQRSSHIASHHYPGMAKRIIVVRAPRLFKIAWSMCQHFFHPRVHEKLIVASEKDYLEALSKYMDLDVLPTVIYDKGKGEKMPGWFENVLMEGGFIPAHVKVASSS